MTGFPARIAAALTLSLAVALAPGVAHAVEDDGGVQSWSDVPTQISRAQTVWEPTRTLGIDLHSTTDITIQSCGKKEYVVSALYSNATAVKDAPGFYISESPGCADGGFTYYGKVRSFRTAYGSFTVFAQCGWNSAKDRPRAGYDGGDCSAADVKKMGGLVIYDQTRKTKAAKKTTTTIESDGLSYAQLVAIARGLKPLY
jgi:hypothetical protein